jgi:hypothetical protein
LTSYQLSECGDAVLAECNKIKWFAMDCCISKSHALGGVGVRWCMPSSSIVLPYSCLMQNTCLGGHFRALPFALIHTQNSISSMHSPQFRQRGQGSSCHHARETHAGEFLVACAPQLGAIHRSRRRRPIKAAHTFRAH